MNEVLAAAKRLRANENAERVFGWTRQVNDNATIASAALAEGKYLEDDGDAVTEEWLEAATPTGKRHGGCGPWSIPLSEYRVPTGNVRWELQIWPVLDGQRGCDIRILSPYVPYQFQLDIPAIENTRGQLRSLLAALGIVKGAE